MITLLKDVVVVKPLEAPIQSTTVILPERVDQGYSKGIKAKVLFVGSKFRFKDFVKKGSIVIVPNHLGNRHTLNGEQVRFYDGEDVLAMISDHSSS